MDGMKTGRVCSIPLWLCCSFYRHCCYIYISEEQSRYCRFTLRLRKGGIFMNEQLFNIISLLIPVFGAIITGFLIPYLKTKLSSARTDEIARWTTKAVEAAEVLFDVPGSGEEKRDYVIHFIDKMFNSRKEVITRDQIRILLEAAWSQINTH